jgi:DMSO reductase family type II enzyme heme b subunit
MKNRKLFLLSFLTVLFASFYILSLPKKAICGQVYAVKSINFAGRVLPLSAVWRQVAQKPVPLNIMTYAVKKAYFKAMVVHGRVYFRLKWYDRSPVFKIKSPNMFADGAAIAFPLSPVKGYLPPICMGGSGLKNEVNIWHWRANFKGGYAENLVSGGMGTLTVLSDPSLHQDAKWKNGYWYVEFSRPLRDRNGAMLKRGTVYYAAAGVWDGADRERAMKKSVSYWFPIKIN